MTHKEQQARLEQINKTESFLVYDVDTKDCIKFYFIIFYVF